MNDTKELVLLKTTITEKKSDPPEQPSCHSKPGAKHICRATGNRKLKFGSNTSHGAVMMLEVSLQTMSTWHENTKGRFLRIGRA